MVLTTVQLGLANLGGRRADVSEWGFIGARAKAHVGSESFDLREEGMANVPQEQKAGVVGGLRGDFHFGERRKDAVRQ